MFTGLVEALGRVVSARPSGSSRRLAIEAPFAAEVEPGESVAVAGVCLTVEAARSGRFEVTAVFETLSRSTLGRVRQGTRLNLERSLLLSDRLGGHLVTGHIDCQGCVRSHREDANGRVLEVEYPSAYGRFVVDKGSIALEGVSLTVVEAQRGRFSVALIPHTCQHTTLGQLQAGDHVNLEFDLVAKYVWAQTGLNVNVQPGEAASVR